MTRFIHDQFAKQYLTELFTPYGKVETSKDISSEVRQVDILFTPSSPFPENIETLGILGRMGTYANLVLIEPFRNAVSESEIRSCMGKLFDIHAQIERQGKRSNTRTNNQELPFLWILTPTASEEILSACNPTLDVENWSPGVCLFSRKSIQNWNYRHSSITQYTRNLVFKDVREGESTKTSSGRIRSTS